MNKYPTNQEIEKWMALPETIEKFKKANKEAEQLVLKNQKARRISYEKWHRPVDLQIKTFDDSQRSQRGRTITTVFHVELGNGSFCPLLKGGSDADVGKKIE